MTFYGALQGKSKPVTRQSDKTTGMRTSISNGTFEVASRMGHVEAWMTDAIAIDISHNGTVYAKLDAHMDGRELRLVRTDSLLAHVPTNELVDALHSRAASAAQQVALLLCADGRLEKALAAAIFMKGGPSVVL